VQELFHRFAKTIHQPVNALSDIVLRRNQKSQLGLNILNCIILSPKKYVQVKTTFGCRPAEVI